jgi:hypothetical protein
VTREEHLQVIAMEECDELSQRLSKALRFGMDEVQPDAAANPDGLTNRDRIAIEYNDLIAAMRMLGLDQQVPALQADKEAKVERFLEHSAACGTLQPSGGPVYTSGPSSTRAIPAPDATAANEAFRYCVHGRTPLGSWCRACDPLRR